MTQARVNQGIELTHTTLCVYTIVSVIYTMFQLVNEYIGINL